MKKSVAIIFAASILFLTGCCTVSHAPTWEYKVVAIPRGNYHFGGGTNAPSLNTTNMDGFFRETFQKQRDREQAMLNDLGKDGWQLVSKDDVSFYFKRQVK